jgi:polar amino acid transport system substrate-binding protein
MSGLDLPPGFAEVPDMSDRIARLGRRPFGSGGSAAVAVAAVAESGLARIQRTRKLRLAVHPGDEPLFSRDDASHWGGICVELGGRLANFLGVELEPVETTAGNAALFVADGQIDLFYDFDAATGPTPGLDRSQPLFNDFCVLVSAGKFAPKTWDALDVPETTLAVAVGSPQAALVQRLVAHATITGFKNREEAIAAVLSARSDAFAASLFVALLARKRYPGLAPPVLPSPYMLMPVLAVMAGDEDHRLRDAVERWRAENRANGNMREWLLAALGKFGIDPSEMPTQLSL